MALMNSCSKDASLPELSGTDEVGVTAAGEVSLGVIPHFFLLALLVNKDLWGPSGKGAHCHSAFRVGTSKLWARHG